MKLISLYIENFGGLHQYALNFEDGLTVIEESNGFGKTTLAEFIRAMFYGFPRKAKTLDKSRRQKYTPWNGGKFGGNLVFELDGIQYRVERTFGATPKSDSFNLIDLAAGKKSSRFSEELGLELFQLDSDSFERSTYLPQMAEGQTLTTDNIRSKLSNLVENTNDVGNFEKAVATLKNKRSAFVPYRGSGGSVAQAGAKITELQDRLHRTENQKNVLQETERNIHLLQQEQASAETRREQLRIDMRIASQAAAAKAIHRQHQLLMERYEHVESVCQELEEKYPAGIPEWNYVEQARNAATQLEILSGREVTEQEDLDALSYLEENRSRFDGRIPAKEELTVCRTWCEQHMASRNRAMELAEKLTQQPPVKANPLPLILLVLLGIAGSAAGTVLLVKREYLWGGIALGIGIVLLIAGIFVAIRLASVRKKLQQFHQNQQLLRHERDRLSDHTEQLAEQIKAFLSIYGLAEGADFYGLLVELEHETEDYLQAKNRVDRWQREKAEYESELVHWNSVLTAFFEGWNLSRQENVRLQLLQIRDDRKAWEEETENRIRLGRELEDFRKEHEETLALMPPENPGDPYELQQQERMLTIRLNSYTEELVRLQQRKEMLLMQVQQIPQIQDELQLWREKKTADQKKSDLLDETLTMLEQAKENLSGSYLGPIRQNFAGYLNRLWQDQTGQVLVTPDLDVQLERFGQARQLGYFSAGQADTVMLCMRLALVDALFKGAKPFVILDDPFVNLDDYHTAQALQLLRSLAQDRQILYLTCNSSRVP